LLLRLFWLRLLGLWLLSLRLVGLRLVGLRLVRLCLFRFRFRIGRLPPARRLLRRPHGRSLGGAGLVPVQREQPEESGQQSRRPKRNRDRKPEQLDAAELQLLPGGTSLRRGRARP